MKKKSSRKLLFSYYLTKIYYKKFALRIGKGEETIGTSAQGAKEVILDFGRAINQSGTTNQVRIWMNESGTAIRSLHPYLGR